MSMDRRVVIESPLAGDVQFNLRYVLWLCRYAYETGYRPIASHMLCTWFMDDANEVERADGIAWPWVWDPSVPHWFGVDLGMSSGMQEARLKCRADFIDYKLLSLQEKSPSMWSSFKRGEWPPHTEGFEVARG